MIPAAADPGPRETASIAGSPGFFGVARADGLAGC